MGEDDPWDVRGSTGSEHETNVFQDPTSMSGGDVFDNPSDNTPVLGHLGNLENANGDLATIGLTIADLGNNIAGAIADPVGFVAAAGLSIVIDLVQPLEDFIGLFTGNSERMALEIAKWELVNTAMTALADEVGRLGGQPLASWTGDAADVGKTRIAELAEAIDAINITAGTLKEILGYARMLAEVLMALLKGFLAQFVEKLIYKGLIALASSWATFGSSMAIYVAESVVDYLMTFQQFMYAYNRGSQIFRKMQPIMGDITRMLGGTYGGFLLTAAMNIASGNGSGAPENDSDMSGSEIDHALQ